MSSAQRLFRPAAQLSRGLLLALAACAAAPTGDPHRHRHTVTLTISDAAVLPAPTVAVPTFATVVWRNSGTSPIEIEVAAATCNECDTVLGFVATDHGVRSVSIPPQGVATHCFHHAGEFAFTTRGNGTEQHGTIQVGGPR